MFQHNILLDLNPKNHELHILIKFWSVEVFPGNENNSAPKKKVFIP